MIEKIFDAVKIAVCEVMEAGRLHPGDLLVVGCSSSEILGEKIGTHSSTDAAEAVVSALLPVLKAHSIFLAAQCCEHLNRALIVEAEYARLHGLEQVNAVPQPKAGGSFAAGVYHAMTHPIAVEHVKADAGMDIGDTLIGMHLKEVAVPLRISVKKIGEANLVCARTRPKCIGGSRAVYDEALM